MPFFSKVTALTALNATETNKTEIGTLTTPGGATKIVGVLTSLACAGLTTLESISGILELESADSPWDGTQQFVLPMQNPLTSGSTALNPFIFPTNIKTYGGQRVVASITADKALTINPSARVQLMYE